MAYTPQEWRNDDPTTPLSADRLNHIEQGIAEVELTPGPKGDNGADGFPTEAQWNDLVARVDALEEPAG